MRQISIQSVLETNVWLTVKTIPFRFEFGAPGSLIFTRLAKKNWVDLFET